MKKKIAILKKEERKIEVSQDKSGINLFLFNPNLGYDESEFNTRAEKSENHLDINETNIFLDLEHFLGRKTVLNLT